MKLAKSRPRVAILGCGAVGRALAMELLRAGRPAPFGGQLRAWSRSRRSITKLQALLKSRSRERRLVALESAEEALAEADVLLLCLSDEAIAPMARRLAQAGSGLHGQVVLITNGYLPLASLAPLRSSRCALGRLHPLAPFPPGLDGSQLSSATYALEGDGRALRAAKTLVQAMGGKVLMLANRPGSAAAYHAGASLLSGGLVALFHLAEQVMSDSVRSRTALREALHDFAETTLGNIGLLGPEQALTGALARGSESTVHGHLAALRRVPAALDLYRRLGESMLELAVARGSIDSRQARSLRSILRDGSLQHRKRKILEYRHGQRAARSG